MCYDNEKEEIQSIKDLGFPITSKYTNQSYEVKQTKELTRYSQKIFGKKSKLKILMMICCPS